MKIFEVIILGIGLAMDAAAVSMTNGLVENKMKFKKAWLIAFTFGVFQGVMPLIGYLTGSIFTEILSKITPYIALILLSILGGKMIYDGIKHDEEDTSKSITIKVLLLQAVATSIDALTVGLIFVGEGLSHVIVYIGIIALVTFFISLASIYIGKKFKNLLANKAEIFGGIILIFIGVKIFIDYLITIL